MPITMYGPVDYFLRFLGKNTTISQFLDELLLYVNQHLLPSTPHSKDEYIHLDRLKKQVRIVNYDLLDSWRVLDIFMRADVNSLFKSRCLEAGWSDASITGPEMATDRDTPHLVIILVYP